jgi:phosphatidylserine/phosphatidylglycerophosphate/cardiolipin synthase-like enzyme
MMVLESLVTGWTTTAWCVRRLQKFSRKVAGVLIVEWFEGDERQAFVAEKSHVKFMVVDEECVVVGSSNCDRASACTSGEVNVAVSDPEFAKAILLAVKRHQATGKLDV